MSSSAVKKDDYQVASQKQLGAAISATGRVLTTILNNKKAGKQMEAKNFAEMFETMSDIGRILIDLQHNLSLTRRSFILPSFSVRLKTIADETDADAFLFGANLAEKLKSAKEVEKTSKDITRPGPSKEISSKYTKSSAPNMPKRHLNWRGPPKRNYPRTSSKRGGRQETRGARKTSNYQNRN